MPAPGVADLSRRLSPKTADVSSLMVAAILREVPHYASSPARYGDAVLQRCRLAVRIFVRIVDTGAPPGPRDINVVRRVGRTVAAAGEPLEPLLHALRVGARIGWEETLRESRRPPALTAAQMLPLAGRVFEYIDQLSSSMAEAYSAQAEEAARRQTMSESRLFEALLAGEALLENAPTMAAEAPRVALAIASPLPAARVLVVLGRLRARLGQAVLGQRHGLPVWLLPREPSSILLQDCAADAEVVYGLSAAGAGVSLSRAVDEAALSATVGLDGGGTGRVFRYTLIYPEAAMRSDPAALTRFQEATLGKLAAHPELLETLRTHILGGRSIGETARRIHRHRQTAVYRLRRAGEILGCDLSRPDELFRLEAALRTLPTAGPVHGEGGRE